LNNALGYLLKWVDEAGIACPKTHGLVHLRRGQLEKDMAKRKRDLSAFERRRLRAQQIIFITIGIIVILSMVITLIR
jgi:predicted nucleic acid-binding Zn ribbon protein